MKNKITKIGIVSLMCLPALVACGNTPAEGDSSDTGSTSQTTIVDCSGAGGEIVIDFWHALKNANYEAIAKLTQEFNQAHKGTNGICVKLTAKGDYSTIQQDIQTAIKSGKDANAFPDIATTYPDHVADYYKNGVLVNMEPYINGKVPGVEGMPKTGEDSYNDILKVYRDESENYKFTVDALENTTGPKEIYSLPLNKSTEVMYYNKTFFDIWLGKKAYMANGTEVPYTPLNDAALKVSYIDDNGEEHTGTPKELGLVSPEGIDPNDPSTFWSFEDLKLQGKIIQAITKSKVNFTLAEPKKYNEVKLSYADEVNNPSKITERGNWTLSWDSSSNLFVSLANQANSYFQLKKTANGKVLPELKFASSAAKEALGAYEDLYDNGIATVPLAIGDKTNKYGTTAFTNQYLFLSVGSVAGAALNAQTDFQVRTTLAPMYNVENPKVIQQGTNVTMMSMDGFEKEEELQTKKKNASFEYMKYITGHKGNLEFATNTTYLPTRQSVIDDPTYKAFLDVPETHSKFAEREAIKTSNKIAQAGLFFTDSPFSGSTAMRDEAGKQIETALLSTTQTVGSVLDTFLAKIKNDLSGAYAVCTTTGGVEVCTEGKK